MNKDLGYYLNLKYPVVIREDEENGKTIYLLDIPDLPGCGAEGETLQEAKKRLEEAKRLWIEESLKRGLQIPEPTDEYSGRILLRISPFLHGQLSKKARQVKVSLNKYISAALESAVTLSRISEQMENLKKEIQDIRFLLKEMRPVKEEFSLAAVWPEIKASIPNYCATISRTSTSIIACNTTETSDPFVKGWLEYPPNLLSLRHRRLLEETYPEFYEKEIK
jgi:antitoxin HicB